MKSKKRYKKKELKEIVKATKEIILPPPEEKHELLEEIKAHIEEVKKKPRKKKKKRDSHVEYVHVSEEYKPEEAVKERQYTREESEYERLMTGYLEKMRALPETFAGYVSPLKKKLKKILMGK